MTSLQEILKIVGQVNGVHSVRVTDSSHPLGEGGVLVLLAQGWKIETQTQLQTILRDQKWGWGDVKHP